MKGTSRPLLAIAGATASGKSAIAQEIAARTGASLVSVDSRKVYRGMDIGTAKPSVAVRERFRYALIDCVDPDQAFSAGEYTEQARAIVGQRRANGEDVILVGGSGFYLDAFITGLSDLPGIDAAVRAAVQEDAQRRGWETIHAEVQKADPEWAATVYPTDKTRILRAAEILRQTGRPLGAWLREARRRPLPWPMQVIVVERPLDELQERIRRRTEKMIAEGLLDEVRELLQLGYDRNSPGMATVGYIEALECIEGLISESEMRQQIIIHTRQYAKRQRTWFRHRSYSHPVCCDRNTVQRVISLWTDAPG